MKKLDYEKKKKIKNIKTVIYGRTMIVLLAVAVQFVLLFLSLVWLRDYSGLFFSAFTLISAAVVLHLFNDKGTPDVKLTWLLPIAVFPVFGGIFYLFIQLQLGTQVLQRRVKQLHELRREAVRQNEDVRDRIAKESSHMGQFADYMIRYNNSPVYEHTQVTYYALGDHQFPDILEELKKAEKFIFLEYFIVEEGLVWNSILEILQEKVKEGVEVRMMYDGMCSLSLLPTSYPKKLESLGIKCKIFSQIYPIFSSHYNNRDHRKILVIDGKVAFTGGTNLADEYINRKLRFGHWKDCAVKIKGDAVERFTDMFLEMWNVSERTEENPEAYHLKEASGIVSNGYCIPYEAEPFDPEHVGKRVYLDILNTATTYVHIMTPYLVIDNETMVALTYAAKRGVEVAIIMPHIPDKKYAFVLAKTYFNELLEAGVKIYEYLPGFVHSKLFVADGTKAVVGTVNLDYRSFYHHFECGAFFYKNTQIGAMERDYQETLQKCREVSKEDYKKQKFYDRFGGKILRMIAPLM